jgi:hypothetical protein
MASPLFLTSSPLPGEFRRDLGDVRADGGFIMDAPALFVGLLGVGVSQLPSDEVPPEELFECRLLVIDDIVPGDDAVDRLLVIDVTLGEDAIDAVSSLVQGGGVTNRPRGESLISSSCLPQEIFDKILDLCKKSAL